MYSPNSMARRMESVHSDIRGPIYVEAMNMRAQGIDVLRLNTGNPATFGFTMPDSIKKALFEGAENAVAYCDPKGMPAARAKICEYHRKKNVHGITDDDVFIGNGVSELVPFAVQTVVYIGDEGLVPSPSYSLWTNAAFLSAAQQSHGCFVPQGAVGADRGHRRGTQPDHLLRRNLRSVDL